MKRLAHRLVLAQGIDVLTFALFFMLVPVSIHSERNPLILVLYGLGGFALVGLVKMGVAVMVAYRASHRPLKHPRLVTVLMSTATASGIVGAGFNIASLISSV